MKEIFNEYNQLKRKVQRSIELDVSTRTVLQRFQRSALRELETLVERL